MGGPRELPRRLSERDPPLLATDPPLLQTQLPGSGFSAQAQPGARRLCPEAVPSQRLTCTPLRSLEEPGTREGPGAGASSESGLGRGHGGVHVGLWTPGPLLPSASSEPASASLFPSVKWESAHLQARALGITGDETPCRVLSRAGAEHRAGRVSGSQPRRQGPDSPPRAALRGQPEGSQGAPWRPGTRLEGVQPGRPRRALRGADPCLLRRPACVFKTLMGPLKKK